MEAHSLGFKSFPRYRERIYGSPGSHQGNDGSSSENSIYHQFLPLIDELLITQVKKAYEGDTFFPEYGDEFREVETILEDDEFSVARFVKK